MNIPVIDFGACCLGKEYINGAHMDNLSKELNAAFADFGFVFLENTGITQEEVDRVMDISKKFFLQPDELKQPFRRSTFANSFNHGWVSLETERLDPSRPGDLKESFNISSICPDIKWPSGAVADFQEIHTSFYLHCKELSLRVLMVMAHSLGLDPRVFLCAHRLLGTDKNPTTLRALYYPPVLGEKVKEGQTRCGEHTDYGSISLLFQKDEGLQVRARSGEYVDVPVVPGAVLINIADLMQRWTSDQFVSVPHRVLLPPAGESQARQSVAFFVHPDDDALITCLDGFNKYPPISALAYSLERLYPTYAHN